MNEELSMSKKENKYVLRLLVVAALIIIFASLEALMMAKSTEIFDAFINKNPDMDFNQYLAFTLTNFLSTIFEPALISLFTFFTYKKFGIKMIYKIVFGIIVLLKVINLIVKFQLDSIFYYIILIFYFIFLMFIVTAPMRERVKNDIFKTSYR